MLGLRVVGFLDSSPTKGLEPVSGETLCQQRDPGAGGRSSHQRVERVVVADQSPEPPLVRRWKGTLVTAMPASAAKIPLMARPV